MSRSILPIVAAPMIALAASPALAVDETFETQGPAIRVQTVAEGLDHPWGLAFLPDGSMLVTERPGALRHVTAAGEVSEPITNVPEVDARGQGGLLDVTLDPDFAANRLVYVSYAEKGDGGNGTAVARGVLAEDNAALGQVEVIFRQQPKVDSTAHFGSRLVFDGQGHVYVTLGERSDSEFREQAQDLNSHLGKIVRLEPDGSVPADNPFVGQDGARPEIWSLGNRNVQAAAINPETGVLWEIEHGPRGGDELNVIEPGANYGWPVVSLGINYIGTPVGSGEASAPGMVDSIYHWTPVIAPSGMMFYGGAAFPAWQGNLFVGGLKSTALVRLELDGDSVTHEERLLEDLDLRIRDVAEGPDGAIYVITDEGDGEILRIAPAEGTEG
jgi:glucose/arabinose dehydrogenase